MKIYTTVSGNIFKKRLSVPFKEIHEQGQQMLKGSLEKGTSVKIGRCHKGVGKLMYMRYISKLIKEALSLKPVDQDSDKLQRNLVQDDNSGTFHLGYTGYQDSR